MVELVACADGLGDCVVNLLLDPVRVGELEFPIFPSLFFPFLVDFFPVMR